MKNTILILTLASIAACTTTKEGTYHYHSGDKQIISDEPIGPYHVGDAATPALMILSSNLPQLAPIEQVKKDSCAHKYMVTTMLNCVDGSKCKTCMCLSCDYQFKCN